MALDRRADEAGQEPRREQDGAARQMIADVEVRVLGSPAEMQGEEGEREKLDRGDRAGEGRKPEIEPQSRENDEEKIEQGRPGAEDDGGRGHVSCEKIEKHRWEARFDERVRIAPEDRKISPATKKDREHASREQFVGDEGRERRQRRAHREPVVIERPDETGRERHRHQDQGENESLQGGQNEHAPPLADEDLAVQQLLKRRVGRVRGIAHFDPHQRSAYRRRPLVAHCRASLSL